MADCSRCDEPTDSPVHSTDNGCRCRPDDHLVDCHWPWTEEALDA